MSARGASGPPDRLPEGARRWLRIGNVRRDVADEISFHFQRTVEDLVSQGMSEREAHEEASRRFGNEAEYMRELETIDTRAARGRRFGSLVDSMRQVVVTSLRSVARSPGLTTGVVLAFALGIGANATMLGIIDRLLLSAPAAVADAEAVRHVYVSQYIDFMGKRITDPTLSYPDYVDFTKTTSFTSVSAVSTNDLTVGSGADARVVPAALVSGNFFETLGTQPALGRFLNAATDHAGGVQEVVLSHAMWQREYGGAADVLGKTIDFGKGAYTIVGVAPRGFTGVSLERIDMWLPLHVVATQIMGPDWQPDPAGRSWQWLDVYARLAPGTSLEQAQAEATQVHRTARAAGIATGDWGRDPNVILASLIEARGPNASSSTVVAKLLAGVSVLVLLIACVNVANLLLARTVLQRRETVVRLALGISRRRLIAQIVLEGVVLALLGGIAALAVERWAGGLVRRTLLPQIAWDDVAASRLVLPVVMLLAVAAGVLSALVPALQVARRNLADTMRQATAGGITRTTSRIRTTLALSQTALSVILLVGAGLFVRSLHNVRALDLGFEPDDLIYAMPRVSAGAITDDERLDMFERVLDRLDRIPGVTSAVASTMPFRSRRTLPLRAQDVDSIVQPPSGGPFVHTVSPTYFRVMGLDIVRGRDFTADDARPGNPVAIVGAAMAEYLWHGADPLGKCLYIGRRDLQQRCTTIVGVVENASNTSLREEEVMVQYYLPLGSSQGGGGGDYWFVRTNGDARIIDAVRREIMATDPRIRYADVKPFQDVIDPQTRSWTLGATMFGIFGLLALVVAAIGLYSVLSFDVAQRTREIGIRGALGASSGTLLSMVVRRALLMTAAGIAIGAGVAILLAPRVSELLFDVDARDPMTFGSVGLALILVAFFASLMPALRATRVDPNVALRSD
jgi:predicted permease